MRNDLVNEYGRGLYGDLPSGRTLAWLALGVISTFAWGGCAGQPIVADAQIQPQQAEHVDVRFVEMSDNITQIVKFYRRAPWLKFQRDADIDGIVISAMYLIDGRTGKGMFADGTILIDLYRVDRDEGGFEVPTKVYEWSYDTPEAMAFRITKRSVMGWPYQPRLHWGDLDLSGKEIEIQIRFKRLDGRIVDSPGQQFRVPVYRKRHRSARPSAVRPAKKTTAPRAQRSTSQPATASAPSESQLSK